MSRLVIIGCSPLPGDPSCYHSAAGLRTWQFCRALVDDGHDIALVTFGERHPAPPGSSLRRLSMGWSQFGDVEALQAFTDEVKPDGVVAASSFQPTVAACRLRGDRPLWIDLPGDLMAEAQLRLFRGGPSALLDEYLGILRWALLRGDRFSAVSRRQRLALLGQLGLARRLSSATLGEELVAVIPPSVEPASPLSDDPDAWRSLLPGLPEGAFLAVLSGGFNTWIDEETLADGLLQAMEHMPNLHVACAGGPIPGHSEGSYRAFMARMTASPLAGRVHLLGWIPSPDLGRLYPRAAVGINLDRPCVEAELGSRNRLLDWLRHGVVPLTTTQCELAADLCDEGLALPLIAGDAHGLALQIEAQSRDPEALRTLGRRGQAEVLARYSPRATTAPLRAWAASPVRAGDGPSPEVSDEDPVVDGARRRQLAAEVTALRRSRTVRVLLGAEAAWERLLRAARRGPGPH